MVIINNYKINQVDLDWRDSEGRGAEEIARISGSSRVVALIRFTIGMMVMVMVMVKVMVMVVMSNTLFRQRRTFQHPLSHPIKRLAFMRGARAQRMGGVWGREEETEVAVGD